MRTTLFFLLFMIFSITVNCQIRVIAKGLSEIARISKPSKNISQFAKINNAAQKFSKSTKFDWKDLIDKDLVEKALEDHDDDEKKNFQSTTKLNSSHNLKGIELDSKFNNKKRLARDYRKWANSTTELSAKFGKPSNYDLDANGSVNDYFYRSYAAGKKEFHKSYPLENYDLEEKDLITIHDLLRPHNEQDISEIFSELKKADLSSNSIQSQNLQSF
ncbi:hypothetical protein OAV26_03360 [Crocinitomicaceae bacterium]|nr:hypothetical protein [Crocinitomicaceae bacterium]